MVHNKNYNFKDTIMRETYNCLVKDNYIVINNSVIS